MKKNKYTKIIVFLFTLMIFSCEDDDDISCNNVMQIIDDCGICRDNQLSEDWNATMDDCGICNGNNSSCSACMDPDAFTYDNTAQFHDCTDCTYELINLYIIDDGDISLEVDDDATMYPGNLLVSRTNQSIRIINLLDDSVTFSLDECINTINSCNDSCLEYDLSICDYFDGCSWDENQSNCLSTIDSCHNIDNENDCTINSNCNWQSDLIVEGSILDSLGSPIPQGLYLQNFNYDETYNYSIIIPWLNNYIINGSIIVNDYEN